MPPRRQVLLPGARRPIPRPPLPAWRNRGLDRSYAVLGRTTARLVPDADQPAHLAYGGRGQQVWTVRWGRARASRDSPVVFGEAVMPRCMAVEPVRHPPCTGTSYRTGGTLAWRPQGSAHKHGRSNKEGDGPDKTESELFTGKSEKEKRRGEERREERDGKGREGKGRDPKRGAVQDAAWSGRAEGDPLTLAPASPRSGKGPMRDLGPGRRPWRLLPPVLTPGVGPTQPAPHLVVHPQACCLRNSWWRRHSLVPPRPEPAGPLALARARAAPGLSGETDGVRGAAPVRGEPLPGLGDLLASTSRTGSVPGGRTSESPSGLEPVGAEAALAPAGGGERRGAWPSRWGPGLQPHTCRAGAPRAPAASLARRGQVLTAGKGSLGGRKLCPEAFEGGGSPTLPEGGGQPPEKGPRGLGRVTPAVSVLCPQGSGLGLHPAAGAPDGSAPSPTASGPL